MSVKIIRTTSKKYDTPELVELMDRYEARLIKVMKHLSRSMGFDLPRQIILRPYNPRGYPCHINGRATSSCSMGYQIIMCIENCHPMPDQGIWVLDHEAAHIACGIKYDDWTHGRTFTETFVKAMAVPKKNVYVNKAVPKERKK